LGDPRSLEQRILLVANAASPLFVEHARQLGEEGFDVGLASIGLDPATDAPSAKSRDVGMEDTYAAVVRVGGNTEIIDAEESLRTDIGTAIRSWCRAGKVIIYLTSSRRASWQAMSSAVGARSAELARALDVATATINDTSQAGSASVLFVLSPQSIFAERGQLSDAGVFSSLMSLVPALAAERDDVRINYAVVWDDVVTRGEAHLRESVVALSWLQFGDAHLTGYGFHVCGGHISRMFIGDTRGYAAARANANVNTFTSHLSDILSEDGFAIYSDRKLAREIMALRLVTAG
jgi:hypothetical protein